MWPIIGKIWKKSSLPRAMGRGMKIPRPKNHPQSVRRWLWASISGISLLAGRCFLITSLASIGSALTREIRSFEAEISVCLWCVCVVVGIDAHFKSLCIGIGNDAVCVRLAGEFFVRFRIFEKYPTSHEDYAREDGDEDVSHRKERQ